MEIVKLSRNLSFVTLQYFDPQAMSAIMTPLLNLTTEFCGVPEMGLLSGLEESRAFQVHCRESAGNMSYGIPALYPMRLVVSGLKRRQHRVF